MSAVSQAARDPSITSLNTLTLPPPQQQAELQHAVNVEMQLRAGRQQSAAQAIR